MNFQTRFQITKVDADKHEVGGILTAEVIDKDAECMDYLSSKPFFQSWSNEFKAATSGKSLGNVREQHSLKAVGKFVDVQFNDTQKSISGTAKIVDEDAWKKCVDGIYTGFSIGGVAEKTWFDSKINARKFTANPREVSIVDNPACGVSHFEFIRAGAVELKKFAASSVDATSDPYTPPDELDQDPDADADNDVHGPDTDEDTVKAASDDEDEMCDDKNKTVDANYVKTMLAEVIKSVGHGEIQLLNALEECQKALETSSMDGKIEIEKGARKTVAQHLNSLKKSAAAHVTAIEKAVETIHKALGFTPDEISEGHQPIEAPGHIVAVDTEVKATVPEIVKAVVEAMKAETAKAEEVAKAAAEAKEKAEVVVGDRKDIDKTAAAKVEDETKQNATELKSLAAKAAGGDRTALLAMLQRTSRPADINKVLA